MTCARACGLRIDSEIELPELLPDRDGKADVTIRVGPVTLPRCPTEEPARVISGNASSTLLYWNRVGAFLVEGGTDVTVSPVLGVEEGNLRLILTGPILGVLLLQRGVSLFHGAVLASPEARVAFGVVAKKGVGKSTTAAALYNAGYSMMSDDLMALSVEEGEAMVLPSFPSMKLHGESAKVLIGEGESVTEYATGFRKQRRSVEERFVAEPTPLQGVLVLQTGEEPRIRRLTGFEAIRALLPHWYGALFEGALLPIFGPDRHFKEAVDLAQYTEILSLERPWSLERLDDLVSEVESVFSTKARRS